jgi:hypothetical protein
MGVPPMNQITGGTPVPLKPSVRDNALHLGRSSG